MDLKIVISDRHDIVRAGLRWVLDKDPELNVVAEASDVTQAVALARDLVPDIVVLELPMPGPEGLEATRQIVSLHKTRVIALSADADHDSVIDVLNAGASGYLLKMHAAEELIAAIQSVRTGKIALSSRIDSAAIESRTNHAEPQNHSRKKNGLTPRERDVLRLVADGKTTKEISDTLNVSIKTIEAHRSQIMTKLGLRSIAGLTKFAIRQGLTRLNE